MATQEISTHHPQNPRDLSVSLRADHPEVYTGADRFADLLDSLETALNRALDRSSCGSDSSHFINTDDTDYVVGVEEVAKCLNEVMTHASEKHREGFLRAVCSFLSCHIDGGTPVRGWDPIADTTFAYEHRSVWTAREQS